MAGEGVAARHSRPDQGLDDDAVREYGVEGLGQGMRIAFGPLRAVRSPHDQSNFAKCRTRGRRRLATHVRRREAAQRVAHRGGATGAPGDNIRAMRNEDEGVARTTVVHRADGYDELSEDGYHVLHHHRGRDR